MQQLRDINKPHTWLHSLWEGLWIREGGSFGIVQHSAQVPALGRAARKQCKWEDLIASLLSSLRNSPLGVMSRVRKGLSGGRETTERLDQMLWDHGTRSSAVKPL